MRRPIPAPVATGILHATVGSGVQRRALGAVQGVLRRVWQRSVVKRGLDVTGRSARLACVVVAPHPDDETLGCGATIARKRAAGTRVVVVVAADGGSSHVSEVVPREALVAMRRAEVLAACRRLGVPSTDVVLLGHPDGTLDDHLDEIADVILRSIEDADATEVLVSSHRDWHPDHGAAYRAAEAAVRRAGPTVELRQYPVWWWVEGPWERRPGATRAAKAYGLVRDWRTGRRVGPASLVTVGDAGATKRAALAEHRSQTTNLTGETSWAVFDDGFVAAFLDRSVEVFLPPD